MIPQWTSTEERDLVQGDFLLNCLIPLIPDDFGAANSNVAFVADVGNLIVVTQTCDLLNSKTEFAALCPIFTIEEFEASNPTYSKKGVWEEVRKGRREGLHMIASPITPVEPRTALVVDFHKIHSLPIGYLRTHAAALGPRWRLQSPYLEHFSQAFARFFMRVGLPSAIPPFAD